jgi:curved DNA-binding protein CbpA
MKRFDEQDPWQVLGLAPGASEDEIRHAYEQLSSLLAPGSLSLYAAAEPEEQRQLQDRLREAYLRLGGGERPVQEACPADEPPEPSSLRAAVEVGAGSAAGPTAPSEETPGATAAAAEFSGARLRTMREDAGVSLRELSDRTRIRPQQLANLEEEAWDAMPPRVYVRGFVMAYARVLKLDQEQVWASFEKRWRRARPAPVRAANPPI